MGTCAVHKQEHDQGPDLTATKPNAPLQLIARFIISDSTYGPYEMTDMQNMAFIQSKCTIYQTATVHESKN